MQDDDPADSPEDPLAGLLQQPDKGSATPVGAAEAAGFQQRAQLAEDRLTEVLNAYRQLKTDNEASRERVTKNLERRFEQRRERLLLKFIEILDNLDRALEATEQVYTGTPMIEGIILVRTQLLSVLKEEGLDRIPVLGLPYDPSVAEAVETRPVTEPEHHHVVVKELLRGYRLNGRLARPANVAVGEHKSEAEVAAPADKEPLVGADEVAAPPVEAPAPPELKKVSSTPADEIDELPDDPPDPPAEEPVLRGFDDAFDDLLAEPDPPEPPPVAAPPKKPAPSVLQPPKYPTEEIDLRQVLDDEDA